VAPEIMCYLPLEGGTLHLRVKNVSQWRRICKPVTSSVYMSMKPVFWDWWPRVRITSNFLLVFFFSSSFFQPKNIPASGPSVHSWKGGFGAKERDNLLNK
jgi:hypothetical protein